MPSCAVTPRGTIAASVSQGSLLTVRSKQLIFYPRITAKRAQPHPMQRVYQRLFLCSRIGQALHSALCLTLEHSVGLTFSMPSLDPQIPQTDSGKSSAQREWALALFSCAASVSALSSTFGTSMPSAVARSIWWSCSFTRIPRISSAMANSPMDSHCRTLFR